MTGKRQPSFSRLKTVSRSDHVRDQLEGAILREEYAAGDRLPAERELAEAFGVSRVSVREGVRSLEAVGLVEVRHGNGIFVGDLSQRGRGELRRWLEMHREEALDLLRVRGALDELAAEEAAARGDPEALARTRSAHEAFAAAAAAADPDLGELTLRDVAFHEAIAQASGSTLLADVLCDLHEHLADVRRVSFEPRERPAASAVEHATILAAILAGDGEAARAATAQHLGEVHRILEQTVVEEPGTAG